RALRNVYLRVTPDVAHHVSLQSTVLGSLAALGQRVACVNALTGLGYTYTSGGAKALVLRPVLSTLLRFLLNGPRQTVLVQNPDDYEGMRSLGVAAERIVTIPGSGVDTDQLKPLPEPPGSITMAFVGRLLADKGIHTLIRAQRRLRQHGTDVELL